MSASADYDDMQLTEDEKEAITDELIKDTPGIYTQRQLARKDREFKKRTRSRAVITAYIKEDYTELENALVESFIGDIRDASNKAQISDIDFDMVCMRSKKMTYSEIAAATGLSASTCYEHIKLAIFKTMQLPYFGLQADILDMQRCLQSNWYRMFRELMEWSENGRK